MQTVELSVETALVHQLFEAQVARSPLAIAVEFEGQILTYQDLNERANQLAHYLQTMGVAPDVLVGICIERSLDMIVALLGVLKAGGAYVPLDPAYPTERLAFMLDNTQAPILLTQQALIDRLPTQTASIFCLDSDWSAVANYSTANLFSQTTPDHLAYVIYTSGSTGKPKGVAMPHRPLTNLINWQLVNSVTSTGKTLQFSPISFDVSFQEIFGTLAAGGTLVLISEHLRRDSLNLLRLIDQHAVERLFLPFIALQHLAEVALHEAIIPSTLREIITAGEQLRITAAIATWLDQLPSCTLHNQYGPSESHVVTAYTLTGSTSSWSILPPIGYPIANTEIYLLDEQLQPVPVNTPGELYIGGLALARGYFNRHDLTAERFIAHPLDVKSQEAQIGSASCSVYPLSSKLYKTGDLAQWLPDGTIEYLGRIDQQVKIRGYRIEPGEVEACLEQHPAVQQAVVVAREDEPGDKRLVAYIIPAQNVSHEALENNFSLKAVRQFLQAQMPEYMVPSAIVLLSEFPVTPSGKVDRRSLPAPTRTVNPSEFIAAQTGIEAALAAIWAEVLKLEQVSTHDRFLDLGGHSLLAVQVISRIRDRLHVELPLRYVLESPTVCELAIQIETILHTPTVHSPIPRCQRDRNLPLSFMQESLWFLDQLMPNHPFYNVPEAFRLHGSLNTVALEQSLQEIIHRHDALRTTFAIVDGKPVQVIRPASPFHLPVVDLTLPDYTSAEQETHLRKLLIKEARMPFNLSDDLLLRATVFKLSETDAVLLLNLHHIVSDGWSSVVLLQELSTLYSAFAAGNPAPLTELAIQYADFAVWQREWLQGDRRTQQLTYWQQQLSNLPMLQLPCDYQRPLVPSYQGARQYFAIPNAITQQIKELSSREGVTLFTTLLTAFQTLLFHYTGQTDIPVGSLVANRSRSELETLIGFFVNTVVLRTDLSGSPSFQQLLHRVKAVTLDAYTHDEFPFEQLVQVLQPDRDLAQNPLVQVLFNLQAAPATAWNVPELSLTPVPIDNGTAKFDLLLDVTDTSDGLIGFFEYSTDLFAVETIDRMVGHFQTLLNSLITHLDQPFSTLPILTEAEQHQIEAWNATQADFPLDQCVHHLIEAQVEQSPDRIAVTFGEDFLTYRQLNERANQLAHHLQALGIQPNQLVGICVERSLDLIVGLVGILKAGGAYVPLDPAYPQERLAFMLDDAQVKVLLTQHAFLDRLPIDSTTVVCIDRDWDAIGTASTLNPISAFKPNDLAYILYTSGSTGKPKGVKIEQRSLVNLLHFMRQTPGLTDQDTLLAVTTISFDIAGVEIYLPLITGAQIALVSRCVAADATRLVKTLEQSEATFMQATPATWRLLLAAGWQGNPNLRIVCCGEALSRELANQLLERCHTLWNMYGPTETTIYSTIYKVEPGEGLVAIGHPVANTQIHLLAQDEAGGFRLVPTGVAGELYIGGDGLAQGYLNRPDLTDERFIPNPFRSSLPLAIKGGSDYLYKTGDLARYRPDGVIEYLGRIDHQVKIRGFRIELGDIESALNQHPTVKEAVVIAREDKPGDKRLVAYVVASQLKGSNHLVSELRAFLKRKLPEFMVPTAFAMMDSLPLTPNGKVDRRMLPVPNSERPDLQAAFVAPRSGIEHQLAEIWAQVLDLDRVGIHDNFFELGGHSLLAAQILFQLQTKLHVEIALINLFTAPTIAELAQLITEQQTGTAVAAIAPATLDLQAESVLDPAITAGQTVMASIDQPANVFLTGVTGFLGNFLLHELLEQTQANVYCLVRATSDEAARQRIQRSLEFYSLWDADRSHRIIPVVGDLACPRFGLSESQFQALTEAIDIIYHNGSFVNFVYPYSVLKAANVLGTQDVLRLASQTKIKPVHFLSSFGVYAPIAYGDGQVIHEHELPDRTFGLYGYTQTKWVSENLIRAAQERGIPTAIYRPAWIEGHSQTGVCNHSDFLRSLIKGCIQLGIAPDWKMPVDIVPVDFVSKAIVHLSKQPASWGKAFNLSNPTIISWNQLVAWMQRFGYSLEHVPYQEWVVAVRDRLASTPENALYPYLTFLSEQLFEPQMTVPEIYFQTSWIQFGCQNVINGLADTSIHYPPINDELLNTYFSYFIQNGFIEPPHDLAS